MRTRILTLTLTFALAGCATTRFAVLEGVLVGDRLATGSEMAGVRVSRAGEAPVTVPGMDLRKGDRIVTGPDVGALVTLEAGYELVLEPNTDIEILNPSLFMRAGEAFVQRWPGYASTSSSRRSSRWPAWRGRSSWPRWTATRAQRPWSKDT